jgi:DSBA-like thioredoxin domain-containing protein
LNPVIYADFNCPYSYAMSERLRGLEDRLEWRFVEHAPDAAVPMAGKADPHELDEVERAAPEIELHPPPGLPNSGLASRVFAALPPERRVDFLHSVYRAVWVEGRDISSRTLIDQLAGTHVQPRTTDWQREWEGLGIGVPAILRDDGERCLGIVPKASLDRFLAGEGAGLVGVY